ncbi:MAG: HD domain-containing protein [Planctomycetota bacterium]|nr:MAG: HD domain-containing protein [Planctomycetota bacterium]
MSLEPRDLTLRVIERLSDIGIALTGDHDEESLLERILVCAKDLSRADGGTIYSLGEDNRLRFRILHTDSLGLARGGKWGAIDDLPDIPLYNSDGEANHTSVVAHAVLSASTVVIDDAYQVREFDFSGTRAFDARTGYRSTSMLTVPMRDHRDAIIGVLQLLNAQDSEGQIVPFDPITVRVVESLASQASIMLTNGLLARQVSDLFESFVKLIAHAIDEKSPYTGGHCRRVPVLTMALAEAAHAADQGPLADFHLNDDDRYELSIAAWLHDCGKITTPEWVMDKATKLQRIHDRIDEVATRLACCSRQVEIEYLQALAAGEDQASARRERDRALMSLQEDLVFLRQVNQGGEWLDDAAIDRIASIAGRQWLDLAGTWRPLLSDEEVANLCIRRGTLLPQEREIINHHIVATIEMLEQLPFPRHLQRVPEIAGGHHERMDGKGYPRGLTKAQMSVPARCMGIADIFEALTAKDRPYKQPMTVSQALTILAKMAAEQHVDADLFEVFMRSNVWKNYMREYLSAEQCDEVDTEALITLSRVAPDKLGGFA